MNSQFKNHLKRIQEAKTAADTATHRDKAEECLNHSWELLFDYFCNEREPLDLAELNTLSGIIQKLVSSHNHLQSLGIKRLECTQKQEAHVAKMEELKPPPQTITYQRLQEIERELRLL